MVDFPSDNKWMFNREFEQMKMKIDALERKVYWLEEWKKNREEKEVQQYYKNKNA